MIALMTLLVGTALPANAASIAFYGPAGKGTIAYAGGDSPLVGTDLQVGFSSSDFFTSGGILNFATGPFDHFVGNGGGVAYFTAGGQIAITGTLVEWHPGGPPPREVYSGLIFSGAFTGTPGNLQISVPGANPTVQFVPLEPQNSVDARLQGTLHPTFANFLGLPNDVLYEGGLGTAIAAAKWSFGPVSGPVYSALGLGLVATAIPVNPIPEPSTVLLVASGLAGIGFWRRMGWLASRMKKPVGART
jgi:PEP-CTERM motif-containing protein